MTEKLAFMMLWPYISGGFVVSTLVLAVAWFRARDRAIRAEAILARQHPEPIPGNERLETAVDAVGLELERLAEGQRFVARILTERAGAETLRPGSQGRVITPH